MTVDLMVDELPFVIDGGMQGSGCEWCGGQVRVVVRVSRNGGTPKSSILIGFSPMNHPAIGVPLFMEPPLSWVRAGFEHWSLSGEQGTMSQSLGQSFSP